MSDGFVKLPREIVYWRWFSDPDVLRLYIFLLTKAAFKKTEWKNETLEAGQVLTGRRSLAEQLGTTEGCIRTALSKLKSTGDISIKTTNQYSVITLLKWAEMQSSNYFFTNKQPANNQRATNEQPQNNNYNNINNFKNKNARAREKKHDIYNGSIDWSQMDLIINGG